jgi:pimeloyl-ACP methyl ester carboxylesterase
VAGAGGIFSADRGFGRDGQVIPGVGHWLMEEAPKTVIPTVTDFVA